MGENDSKSTTRKKLQTFKQARRKMVGWIWQSEREKEGWRREASKGEIMPSEAKEVEGEDSSAPLLAIPGVIFPAAAD